MKIIAFACVAGLLLTASITRLEPFFLSNLFDSYIDVDAFKSAGSSVEEPQAGMDITDTGSPHFVRRFLVALFFLCLTFGIGFVGAGLLFMSMARFKRVKP